jgi:Protein of unknown function (DUF1749)
MEKNFTKLVHDCRIADKAKFVYQCLPLLVRCVLLRAPRCVLNTSFFFCHRYIEPLSIALENSNWSLVQPLLSSSYIGYGTSSLKQVFA